MKKIFFLIALIYLSTILSYAVMPSHQQLNQIETKKTNLKDELKNIEVRLQAIYRDLKSIRMRLPES